MSRGSRGNRDLPGARSSACRFAASTQICYIRIPDLDLYKSENSYKYKTRCKFLISDRTIDKPL